MSNKWKIVSKLLKKIKELSVFTGKSLSEALIFASTIPQYEDKLFMKIISSEYLLSTQIVVFVLF